MINKDRIVPVTRTDLLTLYRTIINMIVPVTVLENDGEIGVFSADTASTVYIANEPVKALDFGADSAVVYCVFDFDFDGKITVDDAAADISDSGLGLDEIEKDAAHLYVVSVSSGDIVIAEPVAS